MSSEEEYRQRRHESYMGQREKLIDSLLQVSGRYDNWIMTLSAGGLGISLAFVEKVAPSPAAGSSWLLGTAWVLLLLGLVLGLFALTASRATIEERIVSLDKEHHRFLTKSSDEQVADSPEVSDGSAKRTRALRVASQWTCTVGLLALLAFAFWNRPPTNEKGDTAMPDKPKIPVNVKIPQPGDTLERSYVPPANAIPPPPPPSTESVSGDQGGGASSESAKSE